MKNIRYLKATVSRANCVHFVARSPSMYQSYSCQSFSCTYTCPVVPSQYVLSSRNWLWNRETIYEIEKTLLYVKLCVLCGIMDTVSNTADLLQKIGCDNLIPRFEGKCIYLYIFI